MWGMGGEEERMSEENRKKSSVGRYMAALEGLWRDGNKEE